MGAIIEPCRAHGGVRSERTGTMQYQCCGCQRRQQPAPPKPSNVATFAETDGGHALPRRQPGQPRTEHESTFQTDRRRLATITAVRKAASLTQGELAKAMGLTQSAISRIQERPNALLSLLATQLAAVGDRPRITLTVADQDVHVDLV